MTKQEKTDTDSMTRAEYIAYIAKVYDVPMNLIRYEQINYNTEQGTCTGEYISRDDS